MPVGDPIYTDYETTAEANEAAPPLGAPEGNYKGAVVNDTFRHMMAVIRRLGDSVLVSGTSRASAASIATVQDSGPTWAGTSGGTANAQTLTLSPAIPAYAAGQRFHFIAGVSSTDGSITFNVNGQGPVAARDPNGNTLPSGAVRLGRRHTIEHDGSVFRVLDPAGFIEQTLYDAMFPVGFVQLKDNTTTPAVPAGITATWTRISTDSYLRGATGSPGTGGSLNTSAAGGHNHGGATGSNQSPQVNRESGGSAAASQVDHTHSISSAADHSHTIEPTYRSFSVWERTA